MSDELLKRLDARTKLRPHGFFSVTVQDADCKEAASRIRELEAACDGWKEGARLGYENTREQRERAERAELRVTELERENATLRNR